MRKLLVSGVAFIAIMMMATTPAFGGDYFGFSLGTTTQSEVVELLKDSGAKYDASYSYKGRGALPTIMIQSSARFDRLGQVKEAWLQFAPNDSLNFISVTWFNAGKTFATVRDGLAAKYPREESSDFGFNSTQAYRDGKTRIILERNTFRWLRCHWQYLRTIYRLIRSGVSVG